MGNKINEKFVMTNEGSLAGAWERGKNNISILEKLYAHLFFLFFVAQILSPSFGERTLYLEIIFALINPFFLFWVKNKPIKQKYFFLYIAIFFIIIIGNITVGIKLLVLTIGVLFLFYAYEKNIFYIKTYLMFSIILAIFQFYFTIFNPQLAQLIGPTNISQVIWGDYATETYTNFYTVFLFPRVSGLSREAGFFASFLVAYITFIFLNNSKLRINSSIFEKIFLSIGYILSFSKMSLVIIGLFFIIKLRSLINKLPLIITVISFVFVIMLFWENNISYLMELENDTFLHRFGGYPTLLDMDLQQILFGIVNPSEINTKLAKTVQDRFITFSGFSGFIIHNGIFVLLFLLVGLYLAGVSSAGMLVLLLLTINVQLDTNQNFVVFAYFIVFKFFATKKIILKRTNANN
jgi:hypothetical protein